jgi:hypothetical protein
MGQRFGDGFASDETGIGGHPSHHSLMHLGGGKSGGSITFHIFLRWDAMGGIVGNAGWDLVARGWQPYMESGGTLPPGSSSPGTVLDIFLCCCRDVGWRHFGNSETGVLHTPVFEVRSLFRRGRGLGKRCAWAVVATAGRFLDGRHGLRVTPCNPEDGTEGKLVNGFLDERHVLRSTPCSLEDGTVGESVAARSGAVRFWAEVFFLRKCMCENIFRLLGGRILDERHPLRLTPCNS